MLLGTWALKSYVVVTDGGEKFTPYGEHPMGNLSYTADGRMQVIGTASGRIVPHDVTPTDEEQAALHATMFAYAGAYSVADDKVTHHVELSWNESWNGTDQVRFFEIDGANLTITSRFIHPASGADARYILTWARVAGPR